MFRCCYGRERVSWWRATWLAFLWTTIAGLIVAGRVWYGGGGSHEMLTEGASMFALLIGPVWSGFAVSGSGRRCGARADHGESSDD
ncbi:MAG: hypothetical protein IPJ41_02715 [Phycisphaerales bacterium]|nr:hypothetical protein [Phycisphaerales bacterium]